MKKKLIQEEQDRAAFYKLFAGYEVSDEELRRAWERYLEVRGSARA